MAILYIPSFKNYFPIKKPVLDKHNFPTDACAEDNNKYRRLHKETPDSQADLEITKHAQEWADYLVREKQGQLIHTTWEQRSPRGENIARRGWPVDQPIDKLAACKSANAMW